MLMFGNGVIVVLLGDSDVVGELEGATDRPTVGSAVGSWEGCTDGILVGYELATSTGAILGDDGCGVGAGVRGDTGVGPCEHIGGGSEDRRHTSDVIQSL